MLGNAFDDGDPMLTADVKTDVIDADAHVVENERVWDYLEAGEEKYRPDVSGRAGPSPAPELGSRRRGSRSQVSLAQTRSNLQSMSKDSAGKWELRCKPGR